MPQNTNLAVFFLEKGGVGQTLVKKTVGSVMA